MLLRKLKVCISMLALLASTAEANSLLDFLKPPSEHLKQEYHSGTISEGEALSLYSSQQKQMSFEACADQFPESRPYNLSSVPASMKPLALCSDSFAVLYSQTSKTPLVVVERLNSARMSAAKGEMRTNQFYPDPRIPAYGRAELSDYAHSHKDRGHQSPAGDAPSSHAMAQSFALSNMVPQDSNNNRGAWSKVESDVRKFASRSGGNVFVFTGPLFDSGHFTIGDNRVWVPTRLFKLVYDENSKRAWAFVLPNADTQVEKPMDYDSFVKATGLNLLNNLPVSGSVGHS